MRLWYVMQTKWLVSIWYEFLHKTFSKQAIEIWILIPIIPPNTFKFQAKKLHTKYDKTCVREINPQGNYPRKKKSGISLLFKRAWPDLLYYILPLFVRGDCGEKFRRGHVCLHSQARNSVPITGPMIASD